MMDPKIFAQVVETYQAILNQDRMIVDPEARSMEILGPFGGGGKKVQPKGTRSSTTDWSRG